MKTMWPLFIGYLTGGIVAFLLLEHTGEIGALFFYPAFFTPGILLSLWTTQSRKRPRKLSPRRSR
jgi:hypothetical protein